MSKNSALQNGVCLKLWIDWLYKTYNIKRKPKKEDYNE